MAFFSGVVGLAGGVIGGLNDTGHMAYSGLQKDGKSGMVLGLGKGLTTKLGKNVVVGVAGVVSNVADADSSNVKSSMMKQLGATKGSGTATDRDLLVWSNGMTSRDPQAAVASDSEQAVAEGIPPPAPEGEHGEPEVESEPGRELSPEPESEPELEKPDPGAEQPEPEREVEWAPEPGLEPELETE